MRRFCKDLKDHAIKITDCKKKDMIPLTKEEKDNYNKEIFCHICKKEFNNDKVRDHCHFTGKYRGAAHNTCNLRYNTENTEKCITFSVPIKKRIENKNIDITYKIKFIDSFRFMATSLSKLVDNLTESINVSAINVNLTSVL